jgi:UDP-N-acetylmuramate dehydrogenase
VPAGWLIEKAGWKGFRRGDIGVSPKQALVLINYGKAHTEEIIALANDIVQDIQQRFSITLEREVSIK